MYCDIMIHPVSNAPSDHPCAMWPINNACVRVFVRQRRQTVLSDSSVPVLQLALL